MNLNWEVGESMKLLTSDAFVGRLRDVRKSKSITVLGLSETTGIATGVIHRLETNRQEITLNQALALCRALEVDFVQVVTGQPIAVKYV